MFDIDAVRKDTLGCHDKLFFNSAGASLVPQVVTETIQQYLNAEAQIGGYRLEDLREEQFQNYYSLLARLLNCQPHNIAFAHDATDAFAKAMSSLPMQKGDTLVTSENDYSSNQIQYLSLQRRFGISIKRIQSAPSWDLDLDHAKELISQRPKLVAVTHVPTNSGLIQNVEAIGALCREFDVPLLVDACQSVGQIDVDVKKIGCSFLSGTGRKFLRGPRGTGLLYVSDEMLQKGYHPLFIDGRGATWTESNDFRVLKGARRYQTWEAPFAMIAGFIAALEYLHKIGIASIEQYNTNLMKHARALFGEIPGVKLYDLGSRTCNILTFQKEGATCGEIENHLHQNDVYFSTSSLQWGLMDYRKKGVDYTIRLSPHYFNTSEELNRLAAVVDAL